MGKSLSASTIAHEWRLPLLRLDEGRLFAGIVGESESRVRQMIQIESSDATSVAMRAMGHPRATRIAPCVLWLDEVEYTRHSAIYPAALMEIRELLGGYLAA